MNEKTLNIISTFFAIAGIPLAGAVTKSIWDSHISVLFETSEISLTTATFLSLFIFPGFFNRSLEFCQPYMDKLSIMINPYKNKIDYYGTTDVLYVYVKLIVIWLISTLLSFI